MNKPDNVVDIRNGYVKLQRDTLRVILAVDSGIHPDTGAPLSEADLELVEQIRVAVKKYDGSNKDEV